VKFRMIIQRNNVIFKDMILYCYMFFWKVMYMEWEYWS
jgi:hypothetical protein